MKRLLTTLLLFAAAAISVAQEHPNVAKGFSADKAYDGGTLDAINTFNGNLNVSIPLGQSYTVSPNLSYQFQLVYAGNNWHMDEVERFGPPPDFPPMTPLHWFFPDHVDVNAGFGWRLSFGSLDPPVFDCGNGTCDSGEYTSADGAKHKLFARPHPQAGTDSDPFVWYTRDSTYVRVRALSATHYEVQFPNGNIHTFNNGFQVPSKMADIFGNEVTITATAFGPDNTSTWTIRDPHRTHVLTFERLTVARDYAKDPEHFTILREVRLAAFGGATAVYRLEYGDGVNPAVRIARRYASGIGVEQDCSVPKTAIVPLLTRVVLPCPSGTCAQDHDYTFDYDDGLTDAAGNPLPPAYSVASPVAVSAAPACAPVRDGFSGTLSRMTLPTRGTVEWKYKAWLFAPQNDPVEPRLCPTPSGIDGPCKNVFFQHGVGVNDRIERDVDGTILSKRNYAHERFSDGAALPTYHTSITTVTDYVKADPDVVAFKTLHYYNVSSDVDASRGLDVAEYSLPYTPWTSDPDPNTGARVPATGPWSSPHTPRNGRLSRKTVDASGNVLNYAYILYEADVPSLSDWNNRRVANESMVNVEASGRWWTTTAYSDFDGHGNYRVTERFGSPAPEVRMRTFRNYNPGFGVNTAPRGVWLLNTYTDDEASEMNGAAVVSSRKSVACFAPNGFLKAVRTIRDNGEPRSDLLTVYKGDSNAVKGSVPLFEEYHGGDDSLLPEGFGAGCDGTPGTPRYTLRHKYSNGVRHQTWHIGETFLELDATIDPNTGLVSSMRDPALRTTVYQYDLWGRLIAEKPPAQPWTKYIYNSHDTPRPSVIVRQFPHNDEQNVITEARHYYTGLGRLIQQKTLSPGGWATTHHKFDLLGRKESTTVPVFTGNPEFSTSLSAKTTSYLYDAAGRTKRVTEPDGSVVRFDYDVAPADAGDAPASHKSAATTTRTVKIATVGNPAGEDSATIETSDAFGRLVKISEKSGANGAMTVTRYTYDAAGKLTAVNTAGQARTFEYDDAGMLVAEDLPEAERTTYAYDARGHMTSKAVTNGETVTFAYDAAERLETVKNSAGQLLKVFTYDAPEAGRIGTAIRNNHFADGTTYTVTDAFTYQTATGKLASKTTTVHNGAAELARFTQDYTYNDAGLPDKIHYPVCTGCGTAGATARSVSLQYKNGLLIGIPGVTAPLNGSSDPASPAITYTPAGAVERVQHATSTGKRGILDTFEPDPNGMNRVASIRSAPAVVCPVITKDAPADLPVVTGGTAKLEVEVVAGATVTWFEGQPGDDRTTVGNGAVVNVPNIQAERFFWARVTAADGSCQARSRSVRVHPITACISSGFAITAAPSAIIDNQAFTLTAPTVAQATYKWFIAGATPTQISNCSTSTCSIAGINTDTTYYAEITSSCILDAARSASLTMRPCKKPLPRTIRARSLGGSTIELSVPQLPDDLNGVTFQWYQSATKGDTSKPVGSGPSITLEMPNRASFWVRMTRACTGISAVVDTELGTIDPGCLPYIFTQPQSALAAPATGAIVSATVVPGGAGTYNVTWYDADTKAALTPTGATYNWQFTAADAETTKNVYAKVWRVVNDAEEFAESKTVTLGFVSNPQKIVQQTGSRDVYSPAENVTFSVTMEPAPLQNVHQYQYTWYASDGTTTTKMPQTGPQMTVDASQAQTFWCEIKGTHTTGGKTWTYTSVTNKMHLLVYGTCPIPPVRIEQSALRNCDGSSPNVTYRAVCDWHDVRYQWFEGEKGDTRHPLTFTPVHNNELTLAGNQARKLWVRASLECGAFADSDAATYSHGNCEPVRINPVLQSVDVAYDATATLQISPPSVSQPQYQWYRLDIPIAGNNAPSYVRTNVRTSGRYRVDVHAKDCPDTLASSYYATIRVASAPGITPPQWPEVVWTMRGTPATLSGLSGGDVTYEWYAGEVGDDSARIAGETSSTYTTPPLTSDAKYWVRVKAVDGKTVDSKTMTVKVCDPPVVTTRPTFNYNIIAGQSVFFAVDASGTGLTYQWYEGGFGDTAKPVGQPVKGLKVSPAVTKSYWLKITGTCGNTTQSIDKYVFTDTDGTVKEIPLAFTASICPAVTSAASAKSKVMPNTTTTLSVSATGTSLQYAWYIGQPGNISQPIANSNAATITTPAITQPTTFWARVKSGNCSRDSEGVTVSLCDGPTVRWTASTLTKAELNQQHVIGVDITASEPVTSIQFYEGQSGDLANSTPVGSGNVAGQMVHATATKNYWVRVKMGTNGCYGDSPTLTVQVCIPKIITQPQNTEIDRALNPNGSATLSVAADIEPVTYQWYVGATGDTSQPLAGKTGKTLTISPTQDTTYWVRVTGSCSLAKDSQAATVKVCNPPSITSVTNSTTIARDQSVLLSVNATGTDLTYQWYRGAAGVTTNPIAATRTTTVTPDSTSTYWCRVTSRNWCFKDSAPVTVTVCTPPTITAQPLSQKIFSQQTATLSVAATSSGTMTYQWYTGTSGDTSAPISGATTSSITVNPGTATDYWVRITTSVCTADSATASITYCTYPPTIGSVDPKIGYDESVTISLPPLSPVYSKSISWYRGAIGDRTNKVASGTGTDLPYTTPRLTTTTNYWAEFVYEGCTTRTGGYTVRVCKPGITAQPVGATVSSGTSVTLSVGTTPIAGQTLQWYIGAPGTTTNPIAGATNPSITVTPASTTTYWVRVTGTCSISVDSAAAVVNICTPPTIGTVNPSRSIVAGDDVTLSVGATGNNLTYQWYTGTSGDTSQPIAGATSSSLTRSPATTTNYWCRVTSDGVCSTDAPTITVDVCTNPTVTAQPASQRIFSGTATQLSFGVTSSRPITYQWYTGVSGNLGSPISGATSSTLTVSPAAESSYWVRATAGICRVDSATAVLSMCTYAPAISIASPVDIVSGARATLAFPALSPVQEKRITWYRGAAGDRTAPVATVTGTSLDYTTPFLTQTTQYWVEFEHNGCITASNTVTVRVCKPAIQTQPQSGTMLSGASKTLTVTATGSPLTYHWYIGNSGDTSQPISGATSSSVTVSPSATTSYWVRVTGCSTNADSTAAVITVCTRPVVTLTKTTGTTQGMSGTVTANVTGGSSLTYQWYKGQSGNTSQPIPGATSGAYTFTLSKSEYYWVRVTSGCDGTVTDSDAILYSVKATITSQPADTAICNLGDSASFSVTATGNYLTYQWYRNGNALTGETNATLTTPVTDATATYYAQVYSGTAMERSLSAGVTIRPKPTISSISRTTTSTGSTRLFANVDELDQGVTFQWYQGALGNTSTPLGTAQSITVNPVPPVTYWVRVTFTATGCSSDKATSF